ncbi:MAG: type I restriction endonuclease subunit M, partial [Candidatus Competibacteraceae bacterium]|nr:type I restriction endonuclease subunit M [Candidatus Competibacteraceae bacterium]
TKQLELPRYSRMVPLSEIAGNDYNLNIPRYIDSSEPEDLHDLSAHLQGGIPNRDIDALDKYWQVFPSLRNALFKPAREGYSQGLVKAAEVKSSILNHSEFKTFATQSLKPFTAWRKRADLPAIQQGEQPKAIIHRISEDLLESYSHNALLSKYDIYQILMDYWAEEMQDDIYVLVQDGWSAGKMLRELVVKKGEKLKETPDLVIGKAKYKAELIPPALIVARYFADQQAEIDRLQTALDSASQELETYLEENSAEDGLLADALNDKDKVTKATVTARLKLATDKEEKAALKQAKKLFDAEAAAKKALKEAQDALDLAVFKQYPELTEDDIKTLIVDDKWLATLQAQIETEIERVTQQLAKRVKELEERYAEPLPAITQSVEQLSDKVAGHLKAMGLEWAL